MKNHMARIHCRQEKPYQVQTSCPSLSCSDSRPGCFCLFQCDHWGCEKSFSKRNQMKAHQGEHQNILPFWSVAPHVILLKTMACKGVPPLRLIFSSCSFDGCTREFPTHGKLKHHERVHAGRARTRTRLSRCCGCNLKKRPSLLKVTPVRRMRARLKRRRGRSI